MKKIIVTLMLCMFGLAAHAADCPELKSKNTLDEILEIGLCRNPTTKSGYLSVKSASLDKTAQYFEYLPKITAGINASARPGDLQNYSAGASLGATWLIFDFGQRYENLSKMTSIWRATALDYEYGVQEYVYSVISAYYGLLTADAELKANSESYKVAQEAKVTADKKYKAGAVAKADVLKADTTLASRKTDLERTKGGREIAAANLLKLLSLPQGEKFEIADMPAEFGSTAEIDDVQELILRAEERRPDYLAQKSKTDSARSGRNLAFMKYLPTIKAGTGVSEYTYDFNGGGYTEGKIGISASMQINLFSDYFSTRKAMFAYDQAEENEHAKLDTIRLDVWTKFHNYKTAREVLDSTNALLKSATESERVVAGMYKVGRSTMLEWQQAQADLASAQRQNASAKYDLFIKRAALAMSVGELGINRGP